jgi:hypothetical protein
MLVALAISHLLIIAALTLPNYQCLYLWHVESNGKNKKVNIN